MSMKKKQEIVGRRVKMKIGGVGYRGTISAAQLWGDRLIFWAHMKDPRGLFWREPLFRHEFEII